MKSCRETCLRIADSILRHVQALMILIVLIFTALAIQDMYAASDAGRIPGGFCGFDELKERNPDVVAWIRMDGTHIDYPVVRGRNNFEYLSKDIDGEYYQGGCIFLDYRNSADLTDPYLIIHGHHMAGGAMFSDVSAYIDEEFFKQNRSGELITPDGTYSLAVAAAGIKDAYDGIVYYTGPDAEPPFEEMKKCELKRETEFGSGDKLVLLSTCAGDMSDNRAVVFCRARLMGNNYESDQ